MQLLKLYGLCPGCVCVHTGSQCTVQWFSVVMFIICIFSRPCLLSLLQFCVYPAFFIFVLFLRNFLSDSYISKAKPNQTKRLNESHSANTLYTHFHIHLSLSARNRLTHWFLMAHKLIYSLESFISISCLQSSIRLWQIWEYQFNSKHSMNISISIA